MIIIMHHKYLKNISILFLVICFKEMTLQRTGRVIILGPRRYSIKPNDFKFD
jgi:hypothetical protein